MQTHTLYVKPLIPTVEAKTIKSIKDENKL